MEVPLLRFVALKRRDQRLEHRLPIRMLAQRWAELPEQDRPHKTRPQAAHGFRIVDGGVFHQLDQLGAKHSDIRPSCLLRRGRLWPFDTARPSALFGAPRHAFAHGRDQCRSGREPVYGHV